MTTYAIAVQWPFSRLLITGQKTKDLRMNPLSEMYLHKRVWVYETKGTGIVKKNPNIVTVPNVRQLPRCPGKIIGSLVFTETIANSEAKDYDSCVSDPGKYTEAWVATDPEPLAEPVDMKDVMVASQPGVIWSHIRMPDQDSDNTESDEDSGDEEASGDDDSEEEDSGAEESEEEDSEADDSEEEDSEEEESEDEKKRAEELGLSLQEYQLIKELGVEPRPKKKQRQRY